MNTDDLLAKLTPVKQVLDLSTDVKSWLPEFKVAAESDDTLISYFLKTPYLTKVTTGAKWLVLGRKGTGKTAIYEYLKSSPAGQIGNQYSVCLNFRDYPWPIHQLYKEGMEGELSAYQRSWQYIIVVQALAKLIEVSEKAGTLTKPLEQAKKVIQKVYGSPFPSLLEVIKSKVVRLSSLTLPAAELGDLLELQAGEIAFEEIAADVALATKLRTNAFSLLNYFEGILLANANGGRFLVCLDQLDENWLPGQTQEYSKILVNLILAAQHLNNSSKHKNTLRTVVFLRTDIHETLSFNDKNKIFQDSAVEIRWEEGSLNELFKERIRKFKPAVLNLNLEAGANCLFASKAVRHGATPFRHILRRTFYRPRDIIVYLNKIRECHKPTAAGLYSNEELYSATKPYSLSLYNELIDEWATQKPEIGKWLSVLQSIGVQAFSLSDFAACFQKLHGEGDVKEALRFLFANSIVGQKVSVNWEYICTNPYLQIEFEKQFHVNSGLKDRLTLTENRGETGSEEE